jgi:hypothetical protein
METKMETAAESVDRREQYFEGVYRTMEGSR